MLIRFSFKNFKSFKNENCLDMEATSLKEHEYNVAKIGNGEYLKVSAIYGANASGKTNVLQAFGYMRNRILKTDDSRKNTPMEENVFTYMINDDPISLEVEILAKNGKIYKYGFEVLKDNIISEWLFEKRVNKFYTIFERENNIVSLKNNNKTTEYANIDSRTLFLNIFSKIDSNNEDFNNVVTWFINANYLDLGNPLFENNINNRISLKILSDEKYKNELIRFIKTFESGIEGIKITPDSIEAVKNNNGVVKIELIHKGENGIIKALPLELESNGTRKMFHLFDFFMDALKFGMVLFIDELDAKLHPMLLKHIIMMFNILEINTKKAQLIFTSHDLSTMNSEIFRRDEIWFVAKGNAQNSKLYSLVEFKNEKGVSVRKDAKFDKQYLEGKYGADPYLRRIIDWGELNA